MKEETVNPYRQALIYVRLLLGGALAIFDDEGMTILQKLEDEEYGCLSCALESMAEAMTVAKEKAETALVHGLTDPKYR